MTDIRKLLHQLAAEEAQLRDTQFIAPCVRAGRVQTRVAGLVYTFETQPRDFEGWGIFQPIDAQKAEVVEEADLPQISEYLEQFIQVRLWLAYPLKKQTWLAYPVNESDVRQRTKLVKPVAVHLVTEGAQFETVVVRWDGNSWWFEDIDRRADPMPTEQLREHLKQLTPPDKLSFKGMTPEMRMVYDLVTQQMAEFSDRWKHKRDEKRLRSALQVGGGELQAFRDRGDDYWTVEWTTNTGEYHTSAISKRDLTVVSSGICLSGRDRDFDLQSLVGVIETR